MSFETSETLKYEPGVCNIGPAEQRKRLNGAILGSIVTLLALMVMIVLDLPRWYRLLLFFPLVGVFVGYFQYYYKFCVAFAALAKYHMK